MNKDEILAEHHRLLANIKDLNRHTVPPVERDGEQMITETPLWYGEPFEKCEDGSWILERPNGWVVVLHVDLVGTVAELLDYKDDTVLTSYAATIEEAISRLQKRINIRIKDLEEFRSNP